MRNDLLSFITGASIVHVPLATQALPHIEALNNIQAMDNTELLIGTSLFLAKTIVGGVLSIYVNHAVNKFRNRNKNKSGE